MLTITKLLCAAVPVTIAELLPDSSNGIELLQHASLKRDHPRATQTHVAQDDDYDAEQALRAEMVDLVFDRILHNNMGNVGPDLGSPEGLRFGRVATLLDGTSVDLLINAGPGYRTTKHDKNGQSGTLAVVNMVNGITVDYTGTFLESNTDTQVTMPAFYMSFTDIDQGKRGGVEALTIGGFDKYMTLGQSSELVATTLADNRTRFSSSTHGVEADNPTDPLMLTDVQAQRTVGLTFPERLNGFTFTYEVGKNHEYENSHLDGRHFLISGMTSLYFCKPRKANIDFKFCNVAYSNVGLLGPDFGAPEGMRFNDVAQIGDGRTIDLVVNAVGDYVPSNTSNNGLRGSFASVNMRANAESTFKVQFLEPGTNTPYPVEWIYFSVFDVDQGRFPRTGPWAETGMYQESFEIEGFSTHYLTESSEVGVEEIGGGKYRYYSTAKGTGRDNPRDPLGLTQQQKDRSVTFLFHDTSEFLIKFKIGSPQIRGRNFLFAGKSTTVFC